MSSKTLETPPAWPPDYIDMAGEKYDQIVGHRFAEEPPPNAPFAPELAAEPIDNLNFDEEAVPF